MYQATIDGAHPTGPFRHFWRSTGFTPSSLIFDPALVETLDHCAGLPLTPDGQPAIRTVRIHYLLDLVGAKGLDQETPVYDWSRLDAALDLLVARRMCPFFELMGNPAKWFSDLRQRSQAEAWRRLVRDLARHLIDRYGRDEVLTWPFECWNEPDTGWWPWGWDGLNNYTDACEAGLHEVEPGLRFGGPGTAASFSEGLRSFLTHCARGTNLFSGRRGTRLDFISVHEKGQIWSKEDVSPRLDLQVERTRWLYDWVQRELPELADRPWLNDECDPIIGWQDPHSWHGRAYYAAWATRQIGWHLTRLADRGVPWELLGNDHGFVGGWGQRTLLTCFCRDDAARAAGCYELVKKPILGAHLLWALQGGERLPVAADDDPALGVLASRHADGTVAVLAWHSVDSPRRSGVAQVALTLRGLAAGTYRRVRYLIAEDQGDPMAAWEAQEFAITTVDQMCSHHRSGSQPGHHPDRLPWPGGLAAARAAQEPSLAEGPTDVAARDGRLALSADLPLPGVTLWLLVPDPGAPPPAPSGLTGRTVPGTSDDEHLLLTWRPTAAGHHLRTWIVEWDADGVWQRINPNDHLGASWEHERRPRAAGAGYRVLAEDWWGRRSPPSAGLHA
jgi:L-iduronidase